jgi:hypothetical protein
MKLQKKPLAIGCLAALAGIVSSPNAFATGACYAFTTFNNETIQTVDGGPPLVLRYLHTSVGSINTDTEARQLKHLRQQAYSLVGKTTVLFDDKCAAGSVVPNCTQVVDNLPQLRLMTTIDGAIITGKQLSGYQSPDPPGAHMGINMQFLRYIPGVGLAIGPITLECTSSQPSPTPANWLCSLKAEFDEQIFGPIFEQYALNLPVLLQKLPANTAPACSVFRDGELYVTPDT